MAGLLIVYTLARGVFLIANRRLLAIQDARELSQIFWWGLQMDLSAIALLNIPVVLLFFLKQNRLARKVYLVLNGAGMALNSIDAGYYRFNKHRSTIDLWYVFGDSTGSFGSILRIYTPLVLFFVASLVILFWLANRSFRPEPKIANRRTVLPGQLILILLLVLSVRGWQSRPMIPATPLLTLDPAALPAAQNSVTTLTYSIINRQRQVITKSYFRAGELARIVTSSHRLGRADVSGDTMHKKNVVLFILESFSRNYVIKGDPWKAKTPFLDSLIGKSLFFPNSFANGFTSNQGIVAILGGIPAFTDEAFFYSPYANTPLYSLGNILRDSGYNTNFLMGAPRDHFGFGKMAHMAGIEHGYWQPDFNDNSYYDGNWGIFDGPFFQYGARILSAKPQPFLAVFFTISAHPPFTIPAQLRQRFDSPGQTTAQRSISYTDYALREFFAASADKPWFHNTLFVFCADHWLDPDDDKLGFSGLYSSMIPIFIYDPSRQQGESRSTVAGQIDLAPTVLDLLGYRGSYSGFGRSLVDTTIADSNRYVVNKIGPVYQIITNNHILGYDPGEDRTRYLYRYSEDSALKRNLADSASEAGERRRLERLIRANIQCYGEALTRRSLISPPAY
jgi:phosphoglycerol transferase MdoB-like AlkP superfamily enzyme